MSSNKINSPSSLPDDIGPMLEDILKGFQAQQGLLKELAEAVIRLDRRLAKLEADQTGSGTFNGR